ncbi:aminoglycoside phosphotransferase family protein [Actinoplanes cyaneus]
MEVGVPYAVIPFRMLSMSDPDAGAAMAQEEVLSGGNMGGAVRVGVSVRRRSGAWSSTIQRLLRHLRRHGLEWVPEPLGRDRDGRDSVSYLAGEVPQYPLPDWIWSEGVLIDAARHLAQLHAAGADFDTTNASWQLPAHEPVEVICHNDFAPYNMVFVDGRLTGVIDWDTASPGPRVWDLAYLAYRLVPLTDPANGDGLDSQVDERARRLRLLCDAYRRYHGHEVDTAAVLPATVQRLYDLADFTQARADAGHEDLRSHVGLYRRDAAWIVAHTEALTGAAG